jgi:hypothetical protein
MKGVRKYRKKPVVIEAIKWDGDNFDDVYRFCRDARDDGSEMDGQKCIEIQTLEGNHYAIVGDFIIKGVEGEFYPCKPDIFEAIYERA